MKISVILSAYNGSRFLECQLDSLVQQTMCPDEVLLIDDCSTDGGATQEIFEGYVRKYPFMRSIRNEKNLGWKASFMHGVEIATGDVLFFCDQDDIWMPTKIEKSLDAMLCTKAEGVVTGCLNIDMSGTPLTHGHFSGEVISNKYTFDRKFYYTKQVGAAMAVKKEFVEKYLELWNPLMAHDQFIQAMLLLFGKLAYVDEPLIEHRIHGFNATGKRSYLLEKRIEDTKSHLNFVASLLDKSSSNLDSDKIKGLYGCKEFLSKRLNALEKKSVARWLSILSCGLTYYPTWRTWYGDLIAICRGNS